MKNINVKLYENKKIIKEYKNINCLFKNDKIIFNTDGIKNTLSKDYYIREDKEYTFNLNIKDKTCTLTLIDNNLIYDIKVEKVIYSKNNNNITLEYKIETNDEILKIDIEIEE